MGNWDEELIALLPGSVRVFASAGAGYDWVDTKVLGERGIKQLARESLTLTKTYGFTLTLHQESSTAMEEWHPPMQ